MRTGEANTASLFRADARWAIPRMPIAITAQTGDLLVWVEVMDGDYDRYDLHGRGFDPLTEIIIATRGDGPQSEVKVNAGATGEFVHHLTHQGSGNAIIEISASGCRLELRYGCGAFGRIAR